MNDTGLKTPCPHHAYVVSDIEELKDTNEQIKETLATIQRVVFIVLGIIIAQFGVYII